MSASMPASTARSMSFMCAASIASVEPNCSRSSDSETPARVAISAKPICSNDCSASSAMNASMMRVARGPVAAGGGGRGGFACRATSRRADEPWPGLLVGLLPRNSIYAGRAHRSRSALRIAWRVSPPVRASARVAAAIALVISGSRPSSAISTSSAAAVVPPGEVTFCRSAAASSGERWRSSPAPATVARASRAGSRPASRRQRPPAPSPRPAGTRRPGPSRTGRSPRPSAPRRSIHSTAPTADKQRVHQRALASRDARVRRPPR